MSGHRPRVRMGVDPNTSAAAREGTRTPKTHKRPGQRPVTCSVELLTAYSHSAQAADLLFCHRMALTSPVRAARPSPKRPWSLRERLDERDIAELITAYRDGANTASLATTHRVGLTSVKRLLRTAVSAAHHPPEDPKRPHRPPRLRNPSYPRGPRVQRHDRTFALGDKACMTMR
jgi:hypothetical protein